MSKADILPFTGKTRLSIPPKRVLKAAIDAKLDEVVVIGWGRDDILYFDGSMPCGVDVLWLLEVAKKQLLEAGDA